MIASMTGFAAHTLTVGLHRFTIECKSVNQRFLEIGCRLPDDLRSLEFPIRELIGQRLARGKLECRIELSALPAASSHIGLDDTILERLAHAQSAIRRHFADAAPLSVHEILRWPGLVQTSALPTAEYLPQILAGVGQVLDELVHSRQREGDTLRRHILERLAAAEICVDDLRVQLPALAQIVREKLLQRLHEALNDAAPERLAQEVALFAQKMDIDEELVRLTTHFAEVRRVLEKGGVAGKRLDFLMQELHREANTLGAKSAAPQTTAVALELKVLIEQMREQVQNIE